MSTIKESIELLPIPSNTQEGDLLIATVTIFGHTIPCRLVPVTGPVTYGVMDQNIDGTYTFRELGQWPTEEPAPDHIIENP